MKAPRHIVFLGAGAIGGYLAAVWHEALAKAGVRISLVGNPDLWQAVGPELTITGGPALTRQVADLSLRPAAEALPLADLIICAMKSTSLTRAVQDISGHARPGVPVVSLLNGVSPLRDLRAALHDRPVIAGMVPFNVAWTGPATLQRASLGNLSLEDTDVTRWLAMTIGNTAAPLSLYHDLGPLMHGKLLLNLINPINALSGQSLHEMLSDRSWRLIYAATLVEALAVYDAAGVDWVKAGPFSPRVAGRLLGLPNWLFNPTILRIQKIKPGSRTSMADDLERGRKTEIAALNGEILRLAGMAGRRAPVNAGLVEQVRAAEERGQPPRWTAQDLARALEIPG